MARARRLSETIRASRESIYLSQKKLADKTGVSERAEQAWESGENVPSDEVLERIAMHLPLTFDALHELAQDERWRRRRARRRGRAA